MADPVTSIIFLVVSVIISTIIIYVVTKLFGQKEGIGRAFASAIVGAIVYAIAYFLLGTGWIAAIIGGFVWLLAPYRRNAQQCPFDSFIDYESGKELKGQQYWKPLSMSFGVMLTILKPSLTATSGCCQESMSLSALWYIRQREQQSGAGRGSRSAGR